MFTNLAIVLKFHIIYLLSALVQPLVVLLLSQTPIAVVATALLPAILRQQHFVIPLDHIQCVSPLTRVVEIAEEVEVLVIHGRT